MTLECGSHAAAFRLVKRTKVAAMLPPFKIRKKTRQQTRKNKQHESRLERRNNATADLPDTAFTIHKKKQHKSMLATVKQRR